ncbi:hypothetical protein [Pelagicoccus mobilis]|uniref:Uncharacterized protein n=1 Tax=Pelagicoccus mobilis TaxID=415221 RepID=A0A934S850_9BACT|nr:hypothetical protein [Pelagicoccus mobilis]MBK1880608.1 hypothetical protein [Pelagicoccus mobilis]
MIWIQRADFTSVEFGEMTPDEALGILEATNWNELAEEKKKLEEEGKEFCDPGFGYVFEEGEILHLIEPKKEPFSGFYHYQRKGKLFGLIPTTRNETLEFEDLPSEALYEVVRNWSPFDSESTVNRIKKNCT